MDLNNLFQQINVQQGKDCAISAFCSLENVVLGHGVVIGDGAQLKNVVIGNESKIGAHVRFYSPDQDCPIQIGSHCWLSYGVFGEATGGEIILADHSTLAHRTILLTSSGPGKKNPVMNHLYPEDRAGVRIGKYCWIGAQCTLLPGVQLEEGVILGAHSFAAKGVYEAWTVYGGVPATGLKKIDLEKINEAKELYG